MMINTFSNDLQLKRDSEQEIIRLALQGQQNSQNRISSD